MKPTYDKTDKGHDEIATRKHHLASRLRTLLLLIDGKQSTDDLLKKVAGLGIDALSIGELMEGEFIHPVKADEPVEAAPVAPASAGAPEITLPPGESQYAALYLFYSETIKSMIGLRGYGLQMKVEKAANIEDFRAIREAYLEAVIKAKGHDVASDLRSRLDQILARS